MPKNRPGPEIPKDTEFTRASHLAVCEVCKNEFYKHDYFPVADTWGPLYLTLICDGRYVKL